MFFAIFDDCYLVRLAADLKWADANASMTFPFCAVPGIHKIRDGKFALRSEAHQHSTGDQLQSAVFSEECGGSEA